MSLIYLLGALLLIIGMVLITLFIRPLRRYAGYISLFAPVIASVYFLSQIPNVLHQKVISFKLAWMPAIDLNLDLRLDGLGLMFALIISIIGIAVFFYATQYLTPNGDNLPRFFIYLLLFMFSMLGIVISNNTILMYIFWELTSVSSFLLISYWYSNANSQLGAIQSFMITVFGGLALLTGFIMLYIMTGTNTITEILSQSHHISEQPLFIPMIIMMLIGAFTKSAQFPFHIWLPKAMAAPTPVSAYLHSATMVKAGIFLLFRFTPVLGLSNSYIYIVTFVVLITMMFGSLTALRQYDLKGILAYSTVSQLGMIMTMVGLGGGIAQHPSGPMAKIYTLVLFAGLFHVMNHALFKCTLFMGVGIIDHEAGTRDIRKLNGMRKFFPKMHVSMTLAALSMAGVPFLNGFLSKEMFFDSLVKSIELEQFSLTLTIIIVALGVIASIFTFVYAVYMLKETYWGEFNEKEVPKKHIHEPWLFSLPAMIFAVMLPVIFFIPNTFTHPIVLPALRNVTNLGIQVDKMAPHVSQWHGINLPLIFSIIVIILGIILATKVKRKLIYLHSDIKADMKRKVNGVKIHYQNLKGVLSLYSQFDQLVCVSDASKDQNKQKMNDKSLNKKFVTSRNTINLNKINQLKLDDSEKFEKQHQSVLVRINNGDISSVPFKEDDFKIVTAGRLSPEKGFDLLIDAFSKVHVSHPHTKLYIMGEGPIRVQLEQQIKRLKLEKHVFLLGQRKNPYYIMKQADVFCLTSHYEGQSMVLLEALTLKVNIIASDIIANRYVLGNGKYGTLVSHDVDDITVALEQCIQKQPSQYEVFNAQEYNQLALKEFYKLLK
ncbi:MAG: proton-conducting transporter membrane subunit [Staphylococcus sp.]|nr:proton-conducting transporter membrane subunit [Staphylococcus sp.]